MNVLQGVCVRAQQPVKGIGKLGVGRKKHGLCRIADNVQTRVVAAGESAAHGIGLQPHGCHGHQFVSFKTEQGRGVVGDDAPDGIQQALIAVPGIQGARQITRH